ncbi:YitT family protein [Hymenobacter sp. DG01]|uniref:YitT family protein n=1 Tax=Hymenobacter sp. DG01 TaxID=2584940 RepID=UPI001123F75D|nr:YitT family protein [Hymenobacter sp. DG01]
MLIEQLIPLRLRTRRAPRPAAAPALEATLAPQSDYGLLYRLSGQWVRQLLGHGALLLVGVFCAALGLKAFLLPNGFIDGGVTGISLLVSQVTGISLSALIVIINIPFIILGYFQIGPRFALKTLLTILTLAGVLLVVSFPSLTQDKLLIAVFGGFFLGAGVGLAMRGGGVLDGTEILAVYISKKLPGSIGDIILIINIIIFGVAAWLLSVETALYSILAYLSAAKTVDFVIAGIEEYTGLTIISAQSEAIRQLITDKMRRGATVYECTRGFGSHGHQHLRIEAIFTVVTRLEVIHLTDEIRKLDPHAFIVMQSVSDIRGGLIKKRPLH